MAAKNTIQVLLQRLFCTPPIDGRGERVDIRYQSDLDYEALDVYQKSHVKRYQFALDYMEQDRDVADLACGTGYGSVMLSQKSRRVTGVDIDAVVIREIRKRYGEVDNVEFICSDLLHLDFVSSFDYVVSYETVEHLEEEEIPVLFETFARALRPGGRLIFSTPYRQPRSAEAIRMGFHKTFNIDEGTLTRWTGHCGLEIELFKYQDYKTHSLQDVLEHKDFVVCVARKP